MCVLLEGLPDGIDPGSDIHANLRGRLWKVFLAVEVNTDEYLELIEKGASVNHQKIRGDSFRTFKQDEVFRTEMRERSIIRLLSCFVNKHYPDFNYCQGMNAICGPFLYCMPEPDAYFAFAKFIVQKFPLYWVSSHIGVQAGCSLVDECLKVYDPDLAAHFKEVNLSAYLWGFACVSSLSAIAQPFTELLKLWDFLIAFGPQFNVLCVVAQVLQIRDSLIHSKSPNKILNYRSWPRLNAKRVITDAMHVREKLSAGLYHQICDHATDPLVACQITGRPLFSMRDHNLKKSRYRNGTQ